MCQYLDNVSVISWGNITTRQTAEANHHHLVKRVLRRISCTFQAQVLRVPTLQMLILNAGNKDLLVSRLEYFVLDVRQSHNCRGGGAALAGLCNS